MRSRPDEQTYLRAAVEGANSVTMVIMLYDRLVADIQRAVAAMQSNDIETRCTQLKHASLILQQLEGSLDHERGGPAARNLASFYTYARSRLLEAQIKMDPAMLQEVTGHVLDVKAAWQKVNVPSAAFAMPETPIGYPAGRLDGETRLSFTA